MTLDAFTPQDRVITENRDDIESFVNILDPKSAALTGV